MRIKDIIERFRIDLRERVKLVRIQLFRDHCEVCLECKYGYTEHCKEGRELLSKCLYTSEN